MLNKVPTAAENASGRCGIVASTDSYTIIQASFDDFLAWPGVAAPLNALPVAAELGLFAVETDARRALASFWESTGDLANGAWQPELPTITVQSGGIARATFSFVEPPYFLRLRLLGTE